MTHFCISSRMPSWLRKAIPTTGVRLRATDIHMTMAIAMARAKKVRERVEFY